MNTLAQTQMRKQQLRGTDMRFSSCHFTNNLLLSQAIYSTFTIKAAPKAAWPRAQMESGIQVTSHGSLIFTVLS